MAFKGLGGMFSHGLFGKKFKEDLFGKAGEYKPLPSFTPEQQGLWSQVTGQLGGQGGLLSQGLGYMGDIFGGGEQTFEAPAMRQFQEQIIPGIAEQFAGVGAQSSGAFNQALGQAGAGLAENLAMMRSQLKERAMGHLGQFYSQQMQPAFQWGQMPGTKGLFGNLAEGLGTGAGMMGGMMGMGALGKYFGGMGGGGQQGLMPGQMYNPQFGTRSV